MKSEASAAVPEEPGAEGEASEEAAGETLLELMLAEHAKMPRPTRIDGVVIGCLVGIGASGEPLVEFPGGPDPSDPHPGVAARSMVAVSPTEVGREVALLFEGGDPARPVLMGLMHTPTVAAVEALAEVPSPTTEVDSDGERLVFEADKEIVLRCGKSSITLTRAGKILIKGAYLLTRSSGVNRIQGGSVQIN